MDTLDLFRFPMISLSPRISCDWAPSRDVAVHLGRKGCDKRDKRLITTPCPKLLVNTSCDIHVHRCLMLFAPEVKYHTEDASALSGREFEACSGTDTRVLRFGHRTSDTVDRHGSNMIKVPAWRPIGW